MENLIAELEKMAESNNKRADDFFKNQSPIVAANAQGISTGIMLAINALKLQIALNGDKK